MPLTVQSLEAPARSTDLILIPEYPKHTTLTCAELQGMKLYLRVLESLLHTEVYQASAATYRALLHSNHFHTCLMACAFEVVIASHRIVRPCPLPQ